MVVPLQLPAVGADLPGQAFGRQLVSAFVARMNAYGGAPAVAGVIVAQLPPPTSVLYPCVSSAARGRAGCAAFDPALL